MPSERLPSRVARRYKRPEMVRLKFVFFALPVIGLWAVHLFRVSPLLIQIGVDDAEGRARAASAGVERDFLERRAQLERLTLRAASAAPAANLVSEGGPSPDAVKALAGSLREAASTALRSSLVLAVSTEEGAVYVRGDSAPSSDARWLDAKALGQAGGEGMAQDAFASQHVFYSAPIATAEKGSPQVLGHVIVGAPAFDPDILDRFAQDRALPLLALLQGGKVVWVGGFEKRDAQAVDAVAAAAARAEAEAVQDPPASRRDRVVTRGPAWARGPLQLPLWADPVGPLMGAAPLEVASRKSIGSTGYEVLAVVSAAPFMRSVANYQRMALVIWAALIFLTLVWTPLIGLGASRRGWPLEAARPPAPKPRAAPELPVPPSPEPLPFEAPPPPGDDRPTPVEPMAAAPSPAPVANPFDDLGDEQPTRAYPMPNFAQGGAGGSPAPEAPLPPPEEEFNPEATRVATVPDELLRQAARRSDPELPAAEPPPPAAPRNTVAPEEAHFQEVYKSFVDTRERCGEANDGLTYEKFALKLKKNRDQLVEKYACRTVRFQVYVKEGKAALKATPVKD